MNVLSIVGARPQFVKLAPISWSAQGVFNHSILHTGQHYDPMLSESFFNILNIPTPDFQLNIGSGSHGEQTGKMLIEIEQLLKLNTPDHVIVYGDTNSTLAGALAACKLQIPISHVEAGLRSFNRRMPEETNRILTDHCSDLLFAPTRTALKNLSEESLSESSFLSGDVMVEALEYVRKNIATKVPKYDFIIATIHRPENTDDPKRIAYIISKLRQSPVKVFLYCHPRLRKVLEALDLANDSNNLCLLPPLDYFATISTVLDSIGVITDSGGLQKEAFILNKPCLIVRAESEWVETLANGSNFLDPSLKEVNRDWWTASKKTQPDEKVFGNGMASKFIVDQICRSQP
jgi:UDP-N-acetylglucosamine 2-epimerase (non-hydrolysing)